MRVRPFSSSALNLAAGRHVYAADARRRILASRQTRGALLLRLQGVTDLSSAEALRGTLLEAPDKAVVRDDSDSYFVHELIGLQVVTEAGQPIGELTEVLQTGSADVYVVRQPAGGEVLLPAIGEVVKAIDLPARRMTITSQTETLNVSQ